MANTVQRLPGTRRSAPSRHRSRRRAAPPQISEQTGLLPVPPNDREKYAYVRRNLWVLSLFSFLGFLGLAVSQFRLTLSSAWFWIYTPVLFFVAADYLVSFWVNGVSKDFDARAHRRLVNAWQPEHYPAVDVFLPICGEPVDVLRNTWTYVTKLQEHYQGTVRAYVLDDGANPDAEALAREMGFFYGTRPDRGHFKKAGNLNYGLGFADGKYVLILDADFAPRHDILDEVVPHMENDPRIGILQTPQYFHVLDWQNWVERGAGAVQELFYRYVQVSRNTRDGAICVGSCAVYRREALDENGGISMVDHTEDVFTGFDLGRHGWSLRYIPVALSTGLCPDTVSAFYSQQYRWCYGSIQMMVDKKFWSANLRPITRLCYISGYLYYIQTALFVFVAPLIPIMLLVIAPETIDIDSVWWVLPSLIYAALVYPVWHRNPYRLEAYGVQLIYSWSHVFAIWDCIRGRQMGWKPTGGNGAAKDKNRRLLLGVWIWSAGGTAVWLALALWRMIESDPVNYGFVLGAGLFYALSVARVLVTPRVTA